MKGQNLIGALSGHSVGSKAFARYREIDEDMKRELRQCQDGKTYIGISDDISDVGVTHMHQLSYKGTLYAERRNQSENCSDKHCNSS